MGLLLPNPELIPLHPRRKLLGDQSGIQLQIPNLNPFSALAPKWLMEHGMLSPERSRKAYEKKQRKQKQLRSGTPIKSPPPSTSSRPESSKRPQPVPKNGEVKSKKRLKEDSDDEDDFVLSHKRRRG
ncbi:uncharacterized protein LOC121782122 isoform X3 [Salvia splendens]|uniref:uncharacterized protein LOC121782122 isoform X3 n=1 Tax=Salvia splendens TaxID=180675 RepID=UPI001C27162A|nr:uncharacterized protein LOC121782122 isoform X3 [Salvia splendens]